MKYWIGVLFLLSFPLQSSFAMVAESEDASPEVARFESEPNAYLSTLIWLTRSPASSVEDRIVASKKILSLENELNQSFSSAVAGRTLIQAHLFLAKQGLDFSFHFKKAANLARSLSEPDLEAEALVGLSSLRISNDFLCRRLQSSIYTRLLEVAYLLQDPGLKLKAHLGLGKSQKNSVRNFKMAMHFAELLGMPQFIAEAHIGLGDFYGSIEANDTRRNEVQIKHYRAALDLAVSLSDPWLQCRAHLGLGNAWVRSPGYQIAEYYQALQIAGRLNDRWLKYRANFGLGNAYQASRDYQKALVHFDEAARIAPNAKVLEKRHYVKRVLGYRQ